MTLEDDARRMSAGEDAVPVDVVIEVMEGILPAIVSTPVSEYLQKKIDALKDPGTGKDERDMLCSSLKPYAEWYLQGIDADRRS